MMDGEAEVGQGLLDEDGEGFTFDMTSVEQDAGFEPVPQGMYDFTIEECEYKLSKAKGQPMWSIKLAITGGPGTENWAEKNRKLFYNQSWAPNMLGRGKAFLAKIAPELIVPNFNPKKVADEGLLLGKAGRAKVGIRQYEGSPRNEVKDIFSPSTGGAAAGGFSL